MLFVARRSACSRSCRDSGYVPPGRVHTVLYMLLALGLNVVVGWGGLLDLGYVAFYGIGAYAYALLDSPHYGIHLPTLVSMPIIVVIGACVGLLLGLPSRRLSGDYLAIVTLFFLQLFQTVTTNGDQILFGRRTSPAARTGPANVDPFDFFGHDARGDQHGGVFAVSYSSSRSRIFVDRLRRAAIHQRVARGPRVALPSARTRSRPRRWACRSAG